MVMIEATHLSQHQSLVLVKAEVTLLWEVISVPTVAEFIRKLFAQQGDLSVLGVTREGILRQCAIHPGGHSHVHLLNLRLCKKFKPMMTRTLVTKLKMST